MIEANELINYVTSTLLKDKGEISLAADDNLLLSGLLSSLDVVRLVSHLEQENGIKIKPGEITLKNFKTVNAIVNFVAKKSEAEVTA